METLQNASESDPKEAVHPEDSVPMASENRSLSIQVKTEPMDEDKFADSVDLPAEPSTVLDAIPSEEVHIKEEHFDSSDDDTRLSVFPIAVTVVKSEPVGFNEDVPNIQISRRSRRIGDQKKVEIKQEEISGGSKNVEVVQSHIPKKSIPGKHFVKIIKISDKERKMEHSEMWAVRRDLDMTCQHCALYFVDDAIYSDHMKKHIKCNSRYVCDICTMRSRSSKDLQKHKEQHFKRYKCQLCGELIRHNKLTNAHIENVHGKAYRDNIFNCLHCDERYWSPKVLAKHVASNHNQNLMECEQCKEKFYHKNIYEAHVRSHEEPADPPELPCPVPECKDTCRGHVELTRHMEEHELQTMCDLCGEQCNTRVMLVAHQYSVHTRVKKKKEIQCPLCPRCFKSKYSFKIHFNRIHGNGEKRYECDHCHRRYFSKGEVREHITWAHLSGGHACACGRLFRSPGRVRAHYRVHHMRHKQDQRLQCGMCDKTFAYELLRKRHIARMHSGDIRYPCSECGATFRTRSYVKVHHQLKHLNMTRAQLRRLRRPLDDYYEPIERVPEEHECNDCGRSFSNKSLLRRHVNGVHKNQPQYPCSECGATFKTKSYVQVHYKVKHLNMTHAQAKAELKKGKEERPNLTDNSDNFVDCDAASLCVPLFDGFDGVLSKE